MVANIQQQAQSMVAQKQIQQAQERVKRGAIQHNPFLHKKEDQKQGMDRLIELLDGFIKSQMTQNTIFDSFDVTVGTDATPLISENPLRTALRVLNLSSTQLVYVHYKSELTTTTEGAPVNTGNKIGNPLELEGGFLYKGPLFGVTSASTASVRIMEISRVV